MAKDKKIVPIRPSISSSIEVEQCVLGGLMLDDNAWPEVNRILTEADFSEPQHRLIFASIRALAEKNLPVDVVTLATALEDAGYIEQAGGWSYLGRLNHDTPSAANILFYATAVRIRSLERRRATAIAKGDHDQAAEITAAVNSLRNRQSGAAKFMDIAEICTQAPGENWLIQHYLAADSLAVIFGDPSCGKSFIAIDIACCVATGRPWRGQTTKQGSVLFVAGEGRNGLARRFKAWFEYYGEEPRNIVLSAAPIQLTDTNSITALTMEIRSLPTAPILIVIDTINRNFGPGDENSTADMTRAVASLDLLRLATAATVIGLHHSGHGDKQRSRGSSVLRASVDCEYAAEKFERLVQIHCTKAKDFDHPSPLAWSLEPQALPWADAEGSPMNSAVLIPGETPARRPRAEPLGKPAQKALAILKQKLSVAEASEILVIDWRQALYDADPEGTPDNRRQGWHRALKELQTAELIQLTGIQNTMVKLAEPT